MKLRWTKLRWIAFAFPLAGLASTNVWAAQEAGDRSFTISGTGASDKNFDNTTFGTTGQMGWFLSNELELGIRQSVNVLAIDNADDRWAGATRGFADYHFGQGSVVPFLGANIGGIYGEDVHDTGAAGLEGGLKFYVKDKTFIAFQVEYNWLFDNSNQIDNQFDDGAFFYALGVGFNF
jgi:hypothetical protein